jgi:uncharacterized protein YukE
MGRIRVNTDDLKTKAKDFDSAADAFNKAGDDILSVAISLPSYEGQLSGPARAAGYEIQSQSRDIKAILSGDAQSLQKTAQAFEAVDSQTVNQFGASQSELSDHNSNIPALEAGVVPHGDSTFGYAWDPATGKLTIWHDGQVLVYDTTSIDITTPEGKLLNDNLEAFKAEVFAYETAIGTRDDATWVAIGSVAVFGLGFFPEPLSVPMVVGGGITALISIGVVIHADSEASTAAGNCNTLWNALEKGNQYSESYSTNPPTATPSATSSPTSIPTPTSDSTPASLGTPTPYNPTPTPTQPQTLTSTPTPISTTTPTPTP